MRFRAGLSNIVQRSPLAIALLSLMIGLALGACSSDDASDETKETEELAAPVERSRDAASSGTSEYFGPDNPPEDAQLDSEYKGPAFDTVEDAVDEFVDAYKDGDLDEMQRVWWRMNAVQRWKAYDAAQVVSDEASAREYRRLAQAQDLLGAETTFALQDAAEREMQGLPPEKEPEPFQVPDYNAEYAARTDLGDVHGIVIDKETGEPMADVKVTSSFMDLGAMNVTECSFCLWEMTTEANGRYKLTGIPAGPVVVMADKLPVYHLLPEEVTIESQQSIDRQIEMVRVDYSQIKLPPFIVGTVRDSATGDPVAGVLVSADGRSRSAYTDEDGRYIIRKLEKGERTIAARHEDYHDATSKVAASKPGKIELDIAIDPITTGTIIGVARDKITGQPLANVRIVIAGKTLTTDAEGRFEVDEIESGDVVVQAGGAGYRSANSDVALEARSTAETVLELDPITEGTVRGIVRNAASGQAVGGADIEVGPFATTSDDAGHFEIANVPQGDANVIARKPVFEPAMNTIEVLAMQTVDIEVTLTPITYGTVTVFVTDASTGTPIASSVVRLPGNLSGETGADGQIRFENVPAGDGLLSAEKHAYTTDETTYTLEPATEIEQAIALQPVTVGIVEGLVRDADSGEPIAAATVQIGERSVQTDATGNFRMADVGAGPANVNATKPVYESGANTANVIAAETVTVEIALDPITYGSISGVVVDAVTSAPIADALVTTKGRNTRTNADGEFTLDPVDAGTVLLSARKRVYESVEDSFELAPAEAAVRRISLPPITYGDVAGQVVDADTGAPLANADVSVGTKRIKTDADGRFGPETVDAGPLTVSARKTTYESGGETFNVAPAETTETLIKLEPIRIGTVTGQVLDAKTGESVHGARVNLGGQAMETDADGRFRFEEVKTGAVGVSVRHADYGNGASSGELEGGATLELVVRVDLRREDVTQLESALASSGSIDLYGIHFDSGRDQFKPSSLSTLNAVLNVMKRAPDRNFTIAGHTDSDGSDASNQDLSERRAKTVINWLIDHGIEARRLRGEGFGESRPSAPNDTEAGKALNRRVELSFTE